MPIVFNKNVCLTFLHHLESWTAMENIRATYDLGTLERPFLVAREESDAQHYSTQFCLCKFIQSWVYFIRRFLHMTTCWFEDVWRAPQSYEGTKARVNCSIAQNGPRFIPSHSPPFCKRLDSNRTPGDAQRFWEDTLRPKVAPSSAWEIEFLGMYFAWRRHQLVDPQWSSSVFSPSMEDQSKSWDPWNLVLQILHLIMIHWISNLSHAFFSGDPHVIVWPGAEARAFRPPCTWADLRCTLWLGTDSADHWGPGPANHMGHMGLPPLEKCGSGKITQTYRNLTNSLPSRGRNIGVSDILARCCTVLLILLCLPTHSNLSCTCS